MQDVRGQCNTLYASQINNKMIKRDYAGCKGPVQYFICYAITSFHKRASAQFNLYFSIITDYYTPYS